MTERAQAKDALSKVHAVLEKLDKLREQLQEADNKHEYTKLHISNKQRNLQAEMSAVASKLEELREELKLAKASDTASRSSSLPHMTLYICPNGETMTAPVAFITLVCAMLTVKWGYPTQSQLHDLGSITRGKPKFKGEEEIVLADEDYEAYLARTAGYMQLCALVGRDRDLSDAILEGLGSSPLDIKVREVVQIHLVTTDTRDKTPRLIAQLVRKAVHATSASLEAKRQQRLEEEAAKLGLSAEVFGRQGQQQQQQALRIRPADVANGLKRPDEGWTVHEWQQVERQIGTNSGQLCHIHTRMSAKTLHTNAQCKSQQQQPAAAAVDLQGVAEQVAQLLTPQQMGLAPVHTGLAADHTFRSTSQQQQQSPHMQQGLQRQQ